MPGAPLGFFELFRKFHGMEKYSKVAKTFRRVHTRGPKRILKFFLSCHALETLPGRFSITMVTLPVKTQELGHKDGTGLPKFSSRRCSCNQMDLGSPSLCSLLVPL